ncbi:MAG: ExbD/TolR family protein, partial [Burkholderiales bacterium]
MKFRSRTSREDPEINFIPLIDVLLVILIFLMVTTTYSRFAELQINLPTAEAGKPPERPAQLDVAVDAKGNTT